MNFVRIGCHSPTGNEEWSYRDDGPSFFPPDEYVAFHTTEYALTHYHRHPLLGQLTSHGCIVGLPELSNPHTPSPASRYLRTVSPSDFPCSHAFANVP